MKSIMSRRNVLRSFVVGGLGALVGYNLEDVNGAERISDKYSYLSIYDDYIEEVVGHFNGKHGGDLDSDLVRAMIVVESGDVRFRSGDVRDDAFCYDPLQIANRGDSALGVLVSGGEHTGLIGDFGFLKGKRHTPWNGKIGAWDYSNSNITWRDSIRGGVGWLFHKAANYDERVFEGGDVRSYIVKSGDNLWDISKTEGTVSEIITKYTKRINPEFVSGNIDIGDELRFRSAEKRVAIVGWDGWDRAVKEYSGRGVYLKKVKRIYGEIKG